MATFRNLPLSTTFDQHADKSKLSLDWVLNSGVPASHSVASGILTLPSVDSAFSAHIDVAVTSDWLQYCREAVPDTCFQLSSGILDLRRPPLGSPSKRGSDLRDPSSSSSFDASPVFPAAVMESPCLDDCVCIDQSACRCPSTSHNMLNNVPLNATNIIRDIFLGHHATRVRTSVFHADLPALQHALALHGIPYADMNLSQCRHALIHHIITGTCFENPSNARDASSMRHELAACR
ncbi:hypothetical protein B0H14DRAFT_2675275, partial [Mycena olivaceomarginata]